MIVFVCEGVSHDVLKKVGEQFLSVHKGTGAAGAKAVYRGGEYINDMHVMFELNGNYLCVIKVQLNAHFF